MASLKLAYYEKNLFTLRSLRKIEDPEKSCVSLLYFGARYYNSDISVWLSVDSLSDKYPSLSPYNYCAGNPVMLVDPDGRSFGDYLDGFGKKIGTDGNSDTKNFVVTNNAEIESTFHSHPDGVSNCEGSAISNSTSTSVNSSSSRYAYFAQQPSGRDIGNQAERKSSGLIQGNSYVFSRADNKVYIYNGTETITSFPLDKWRSKFSNE